MTGNIKELKRLVAKKEGEEIEFKRSTGGLRTGMETLSGMLNATGRGTVVFGVSNDGELLGQDVSEKTRREISDVSRSIDPHVEFRTDEIPVGNKKAVIVVYAEAPGRGPFTFDGRAFIRVGNTTQRMSRTEWDRKTALRLETEIPWDHWIALNWTMNDLDISEIERTSTEAIRTERIPTRAMDEEPEEILRRLHLITDDGVTRAAAILFGLENNRQGYPLGEIRLARFRGVTKDEFRDNRQYKGHAFELLRHAERFLGEHIPVASTFVDGEMRRVDTPKYPPLAHREAIINAIVHRDYSQPGGAVSIAIFDDRLEIWSTGLLPEGITIEELKRKHESKPRNPLIADVFHRRGLIEKWGRGTNTIIEEAKRAGCPEPEFEEISGAFVVGFRPSAKTVDTLSHPSMTKSLSKSPTMQEAWIHFSILEKCSASSQSLVTLARSLNFKHRSFFKRYYVNPLIGAGLLSPTIPDKPRSQHQKYVITPAGTQKFAEYNELEKRGLLKKRKHS